MSTIRDKRSCLSVVGIGVLSVILIFMGAPFLFVHSSCAESPKGIMVLFKDSAGKELCRFRAELAMTPEEQSRGLMFRKEMAPDSGMLFVNDNEAMRFFWMKNTYIPLDILFIDGRNEVKYIHFGAKPLDETAISSQYPVRCIFEIKAGRAKKCKIGKGSKMIVLHDQH